MMCVILGTVGNLLVILVIWRDPQLQVKNQLSNLNIMNLAMTDLLTSLLVAGPAVINVIYKDFPFPHWVCQFGTMMNIGTIGGTYNILTIVSVERFIVIICAQIVIMLTYSY